LTAGTSPDLTYLLEGPEDGPVLGLSNSLGTSLEMWDDLWDDQAPVLGDRFRLLRYDTRGHGRSPAPPGPYAIEALGGVVVRLLDRLEIERASFCGLSVGGMTGMWLAAEVPERVERLVLLCTSALLGPKGVWDERIATATEQGMTALVDGVIERWFTPAFRSQYPETVEKMTTALRETDPGGYAGCCAAIKDMDLRNRLPSIEAPNLVVSGAEDPATPPGHGRLIHDAIPGALRGRHPEPPTSRRGAAGEDHTTHPEPPGGRMTRNETHDDGMKVRREVLGDAYVDAALEKTTPLTADFQDFITRYAWGEVWTRPALDRKTRSCITLTALMARGHHEELATHLEGALRNGLTEDEVKEVLLHGAIYCGVPAANAAFAVARRVLESR
jgi:3-oxoadipate enol-lactonase/4-carboxymuconolactone decarboxylase